MLSFNVRPHMRGQWNERHIEKEVAGCSSRNGPSRSGSASGKRNLRQVNWITGVRDPGWVTSFGRPGAKRKCMVPCSKVIHIFKNHQSSRAWNQVWDTSKLESLGDCTGFTPVKWVPHRSKTWMVYVNLGSAWHFSPGGLRFLLS